MDIHRLLYDKFYQYITQCKRYKKSIGILFLLILIAIGWGVFHTTENDHIQMESSSNAVSQSAEENNRTKLLYGTGNNLRGLPWHEVLVETLGKSNLHSINLTDNEATDDIQQDLKNKGISSKSKWGKRRNIENTVNQDSSISLKSDLEKHHEKKSVYINGVIHGPKLAVILSSGSESSVVMEGDSWHSVKVLKVDENCVTLDDGGNVKCVSVGES